MKSSLTFISLFATGVPRRFTLRTLLLITTALGVGLWWWRLPFEVKEPWGAYCYISGIGAGNIPSYRISTYRRSRPGTRIRHGLTTIYDKEDHKIGEQTWQEGVQNGICRRFDRQGYEYQTGYYRAGREHGRWTTQSMYRVDKYPLSVFEEVVSPDARKVTRQYVDGEIVLMSLLPLAGEKSWKKAEYFPKGLWIETAWTTDTNKHLERVEHVEHCRHGTAQGWYANGKPRYSGEWDGDKASRYWKLWNQTGDLLEELQFADGLLVKRTGKPITGYTNVLQHILTTRDHPRVRYYRLLNEPSQLGESTRQLPWRLDELAKKMNAQIDRTIAPAMRDNLQIDFPHEGIPGEAALYLALHPHGLTLEFRDEQLWITTIEAAKHWDRSPSLLLSAPPDSKLEFALNCHTSLKFHGDRLAKLAEALEDFHHTKIVFGTTTSSSGDLRERAFDLDVDEVHLHAALATLCYLNALNCEVRGEELVITARQGHELAERSH